MILVMIEKVYTIWAVVTNNVARLTVVGELVHCLRPRVMVDLPQVSPKGMVATWLLDASMRIKLAFDMRHKQSVAPPQPLLRITILSAVTGVPKSTWNHSDDPSLVWEKVALEPSTPLEAT